MKHHHIKTSPPATSAMGGHAEVWAEIRTLLQGSQFEETLEVLEEIAAGGSPILALAHATHAFQRLNPDRRWAQIVAYHARQDEEKHLRAFWRKVMVLPATLAPAANNQTDRAA